MGVFRLIKGNIFAIAFVLLLLSIYLFSYQFGYKKPVTERIVVGSMYAVSAQETNSGSNVIWVVELKQDLKKVMISPSARDRYKHGQKVELTEYTYDNGSKLYRFNRYTN